MKRTYKVIFILCLLVNIVIRLPLQKYEIGVDSYFLHGLAQSILDSNHFAYILNPLSLIGLYPYSYPIGTSLVLSSISLVTRLDLTYVILIISIIIGILGFILAFKISEYFLPNKSFSMISGLVFSLGLDFLYLTTFSASSRALFIIFFLTIIFSLFKYIQTNKAKLLIITLILSIFSLFIHRLFAVIILVLGIFILVNIIYQPFIKFRNCHKISSTIFIYFLIISIFIGSVFYTEIPGNFHPYSKHYINAIAFLFLRYLRATGILLPFSLLGLFLFITKKNIKKTDLFLILTIISMSPFINYETYAPAVTSIFLAILSAYTLTIILKIIKQPIFYPLLSFVVVILIASSGLFQVWQPSIIAARSQSDERYAIQKDLSFLNILEKSSKIVVNDPVLLGRLQAFRPCLFSGGDVFPLVCNLVNITNMRIVRTNPTTKIIQTKQLFQLTDSEFRYIIDYALDSNEPKSDYLKTLATRYGIRYLVENTLQAPYNGKWIKNIKSSEDKLYSNGKINLWHIYG